MNYQIGKAKLLLASSVTSLGEVARASGFASLRHFTEIFTEKSSVTPQVFRLSAHS